MVRPHGANRDAACDHRSINEISNAYLKSEGGQKMLVQFDVAAGGGTPKAAKEYLASEAEKWRPIVKAANFKMP